VSAAVTLEPWGSGDLPLLERLMGDPHMTEHLGGQVYEVGWMVAPEFQGHVMMCNEWRLDLRASQVDVPPDLERRL
jgi:hypothetical protein